MADDATPIDKMEFTSPITQEGSWGSRPLTDTTKSTMELFFYKDHTGFIEWDISDLEITEHIGLTFEIDAKGKRTLSDYDGVMTLPDQAMDLLERNGVDCAEVRRLLTTPPTACQIQNVLNQCIGTDHHYRHPLFRKLHYTDGAKLFAEMAQAYWFLDIVAGELLPLQAKEPFINIVLAVKGSKATISADDGNGNQVWSRDLDFTTCPEGDWNFYLTNNVLMVPSEY